MRDAIRILIFVFLAVFAASAFAMDDPEQAVTKVIKDYVLSGHPEWNGLEIRVEFKQADKIFNELKSMRGNVSLSIADQYQNSRPVGNVVLPLLVGSGGSEKKVFIRAKVEVFRDVVVAASYIKRGEEIVADYIKLEKRDIAMVPQNYFDKMEAVAGAAATTSISENSTIYAWMIKDFPDIRRGDKVTIRVIAPNLSVKAEGTALEDGYIGKAIKVKRKDVKDPLEGVLVSANEVEVELR